jgi:microcystin-dependent protein
MSQPYLGEIRLVGFTFAPVGWALCDGSLRAIDQNQALFSLLGTTYGGDGVSTFALPDLRGRVPMHQGNGHVLGEMAGVETVTLTVNQLGAHGHAPQASSAGGSTGPAGGVWANSAALQFAPASSPLAAMNPGSIGSTGGSQPHENMLPFQVINFVISLEGIYPSQS